MSKDNLPQPGFVMPNSPHQQAPMAPGYYPGYPPQPQGANYPPAHQDYSQPAPYYPPGHQPFPPPVQQQPTSRMGYGQPGNWIQGNLFNYLASASSFHVKQKVELVEAILGWEQGNKYTVKDQSGNKVFYVNEQSDMCFRQCCNASRPFTLAFKDSAGNNIMNMDRPLDCACCCGFFCPDKISVSTASGQILGSVVEEFNILYPTFSLNDVTGRTVLRIEGPLCPLSFGSCTGPVVFKVVNTAGVPVGTISKEWSGLVRELFTDADYFSMSFPQDLDPAMKAVCLAALFLIDYQYFESGTFDNSQGGRRLFG